MSSVTVFVGLDDHQAFVQVGVMDAKGTVLLNRRCDNSAMRIVEAVQPYGTRVVAAIEACCGAAALADELLAAGWQVSLAHAAYVNKIKPSPDKTDWSDARLLADLLRVGYLPHVWLPPAKLRQLRHVVRYRQQLAEARRNAKLRVTALLRTHRIEYAVRRWTKAWIGAVRSCEALGTEGNWVAGQLLDEVERLQTAAGRSRSAAGRSDGRRSVCAKTGLLRGNRTRDGGPAAGRTGRHQSLPLGETALAVRRIEPAQCVQRPEASRGRVDPGRQSPVARRVD